MRCTHGLGRNLTNFSWHSSSHRGVACEISLPGPSFTTMPCGSFLGFQVNGSSDVQQIGSLTCALALENTNCYTEIDVYTKHEPFLLLQQASMASVLSNYENHCKKRILKKSPKTMWLKWNFYGRYQYVKL